MSEDVTIRKMEKTDLQAVSQLFREVFNSEGENWSDKTATSHVEQNFFGDSHWVAEKGNKIVGFLMGIVLTREKGEELFIDSVVVDKSVQGNGIGKELWSRAEMFVKENKLKGIRLLANPQFDSYNWYKKMGYNESEWIELYREF